MGGKNIYVVGTPNMMMFDLSQKFSEAKIRRTGPDLSYINSIYNESGVISRVLSSGEFCDWSNIMILAILFPPPFNGGGKLSMC